MAVAFGNAAPARAASVTTVVEPAATRDLVDLASVREQLSITGNGSDSILSSYISQASAAIENFCNRSFPAEKVMDRFFPARDLWPQTAAGGVEPLQLTRWPVVSVDAVVEDGATLTANVDFIVDAARGQLIRIDGRGYPAMWSAGVIVCTYTGGYAATPADVVAAVTRSVSQAWFARGRDPMLRSETVPGVWSADYWVHPAGAAGATEGNLSPDVQSLIDNYRTPVVA